MDDRETCSNCGATISENGIDSVIEWYEGEPYCSHCAIFLEED